jgi:hypothetical protein
LKFFFDMYGTEPSKNCRDPGSNRGPLDLQSNALPTELSRLVSSNELRLHTLLFLIKLNLKFLDSFPLLNLSPLRSELDHTSEGPSPTPVGTASKRGVDRSASTVVGSFVFRVDFPWNPLYAGGKGGVGWNG